MADKTLPCAVDGCGVVEYAQGWCMKHHKRVRRHGDPNIVHGKGQQRVFVADPLERIKSKSAVDPVTQCWVWQQALESTGYARLYINGRVRSAHRVAYEAATGAIIPDGFQIDHLCRNRACVNPDHLEAVTPRENVLRSDNPCAVNARKTHCAYGHPLSGDNLRIESDGSRACRACSRKRTAEYRARLTTKEQVA